MPYAKFEKLNTKLNTELKKESKINNCMYKKREFKINSNKCDNNNNNNINYILDNNIKKDECKLLYNDRVDSNVISYKNNKQLNTRVINTIPYKNYTEFTYNPELEVLISSGLHTHDKKSVSNTSEIEQEKKPMISYVKNKIDDKNNSFDISRFTLSSRQIKGNKTYVNKYKKNLKLIKSSLNK